MERDEKRDGERKLKSKKWRELRGNRNAKGTVDGEKEKEKFVEQKGR